MSTGAFDAAMGHPWNVKGNQKNGVGHKKNRLREVTGKKLARGKNVLYPKTRGQSRKGGMGYNSSRAPCWGIGWGEHLGSG